MVRVLLFDEAKGLEEGSELSALLGYFPATAPDDARVTTLGFARTAAGLMDTFDPGGSFRSITTDAFVWAVQRLSGTLCAAAVLRDDWGGRDVPRESLPHILRQWLAHLHRAISLLLGPVDTILSSTPACDMPRLHRAVQGVLDRVSRELTAPAHASEGQALRSPFRDPGAFVAAPSRGTADLAARSVAQGLSSNPIVDVAAAVVLSPEGVVATTLSDDDTAAIFALCSSAGITGKIHCASAPAGGPEREENAVLSRFISAPGLSLTPDKGDSAAEASPRSTSEAHEGAPPRHVHMPAPDVTLASPADVLRSDVWEQRPLSLETVTRGAPAVGVVSVRPSLVDLAALGRGRTPPSDPESVPDTPGPHHTQSLDALRQDALQNLLLPHVWLSPEHRRTGSPMAAGMQAPASARSQVLGTPATLLPVRVSSVTLAILLMGHVSTPPSVLSAIATVLATLPLSEACHSAPDAQKALPRGSRGGIVSGASGPASEVRGPRGRAELPTAAASAAHAVVEAGRQWASDPAILAQGAASSVSMTVRDAKDAGTCFLAGVAALESGGTMRSLAMLPHSKGGIKEAGKALRQVGDACGASDAHPWSDL